MVKICNLKTSKFYTVLRQALLVTILQSVSAEAAPDSAVPPSLTACGLARINSVNGAVLTTEDSNQIQLASIKMPELWPDGATYASWPHAAWAHKILVEQTEGKAIELFCESETISFDGQKIAHILLPDGEWLQQKLLEKGAAYVFTRRDQTAGLAQLYAAEDRARLQGLGVWQTTELLVADSKAKNEGIRTGWFQIIRGTVLNVAAVRRQTFLNFGTNWRQDFTVEIPARAMRAFTKAGTAPTVFQNKYVEVRGWVTWKGGPHIMLEGPGQIRLIEQN